MMNLYHPHAKDWFGTTKQFLYRFRDAQSMAKMLQTFYGGEAHQLLTQTEQEMQRARVEIMALIDRLPDVDQRTALEADGVRDGYRGMAGKALKTGGPSFTKKYDFKGPY